MAAVPDRVLGPKVDATTSTTISYTLKTAEHVDPGETMIIGVGGTGSGAAHVVSGSDTKGNSYAVDAFENTSGSAVATVVRCSPTTQLVAGDVITLTYAGSVSDKFIHIRVVKGLALSAAVDVIGKAGATGAGSTAPAVTTGIQDGVGSGTSTTQPDDYIYVLTVWNGTAVLTEDTALTSVYTGHFDNATAGLVKQVAVSERLASTTSIKSYTDSLDHTQPWAMIVITYLTQSSTPISTLGPHQETGPGNTCTYTLRSGEHIDVGQTPVIFLAAAGAGGAVAIGASDSKGNSYTVDAVDQPNGSAAASIVSGRITTQLLAGDTITVTTQSATNTNRQMLIRVVDGLVAIGRVDQVGSANSPTGATTLELRTGVQDGVGAGTSTTQAQEYGATLVVWNGTPTLTEDAGLSSIYSGHFDYVAGTQTKQMAASEHTFTSTGVKFFDDTFSASAIFAAVLVTYKVSGGGGGTPASKSAPRGLAGRDISNPPGGYTNSFHHMQFRIYWDVIQPTKADGVTPVNENALDPTEVSRVTSVLDTLAALTRSDGIHYTGGIRLFVGYRSPDWLINRVGSFRYKDPAGSGNPVVVVPKFWLQGYLDAWDNLMDLMAARWDGHPAMHMFQIANVMTYYAEELIRHTSATANLAEMVGGGYGWDLTTNAQSTTRLINPPGSGYTDASNLAAAQHGIDKHAAAWPNTPASISYNPYDKILSETEAQSVKPGIVYGSPLNNQVFSSDLARTKQIIDYHVSVLFPTDRCVLENNSVRSSYFLTGGALDTSTKMGQMYDYMRTRGVPLYYQLAAPASVGNFNTAMQGTVSELLGNAAEPTSNQGASPYDAANLARWDAALYANPLPIYSGGGGTTGHAPLNLTDPTIGITSGSGYQPGTILQTNMGTWDAGIHAITNYAVSWYRVDPVTGALGALVRGPINYASSAATDNYTIQVGDIGSQLASVVTPTNTDGPGLADQSAATPQVISGGGTAAPVNQTLPFITPATPSPGQVLQADPGAWTNNPSAYTYLWQYSSDGGTTWLTYQARSPDSNVTTLSDATQDGWIFRVSVIANNGTNSAPAVSLPTSPLTGLPPIVSPFGGPVNMPGWAYGESMPAWLQVDGVEVANWARVYEYLRQGLAGGGVTINDDCVCATLYDPTNTGTNATFVDPVTDRAPWFDAQRSESLQFLGIIVRDVSVAPQRSRIATTIPGRFGGSVLTPQQSGGMTITVQATLVAASRSGADYGEEWLRGVLGDPDCDACGTSTVEVRTSCPPADGSDPNLGYWIAYRAGLTADVVKGAQDVLGNLTDVSWTWTSSEASLYKPPSAAFPATIIDPTDTTGAPCIAFDSWYCGSGSFVGCYTVQPPNKGAWGTIATIVGGARGVGNVLLSVYSKCPPDRTNDIPDSQLLITGVEPNSQLIIDSSQHIVTYVAADGTVTDGLDHVYVPEGQPLTWLEVLDCDPTKCICIETPHPCSGGGSSTIALDLQYRRRG